MKKTKPKKVFTIFSVFLMSVMVLGLFSQSGIFVSADSGSDKKNKDGLEDNGEHGNGDGDFEDLSDEDGDFDEYLEISYDEDDDSEEDSDGGNRGRVKNKEKFRAHYYDEEDEGEDESEIEVEIENGIAKVKIEINDSKWRFILETTDLDEVIDEIAFRTGLSAEEINEIIEVEYEDDDLGDLENFQRVRISPQKQFTSEGNASYEVTIKDFHTDGEVCTTVPDSANNSTNNSTNSSDTNSTGTVVCEAVSYTYSLEFEAKTGGVSGVFETSEITLEAGASETVVLNVEAQDVGVHKFKVISVGNDSEAKAKGVLFFIKEADHIFEDTSFFIGKGFMTSEDESSGFLVDLKILNKNGILSGKAKIGKTNYKLDGKILPSNAGNDTSNNETQNNSTLVNESELINNSRVVEIEFDLISPRTKEVVGSFSGDVKTFTSFLLLRGFLEDFESFEGVTWKITATSRHEKSIREIYLDEDDGLQGISKQKKKFRENVKLKEIFFIKYTDDSGEESEAYLRPIEIGKKKLFRIIPNPFGEESLLFEVVKGEKAVKKYISEFDEEVIEGYRISAGSLEDEESIELEIEEVED